MPEMEPSLPPVERIPELERSIRALQESLDDLKQASAPKKTERLMNALLLACVPTVFAVIVWAIQMEIRVNFIEKTRIMPADVSRQVEELRKEIQNSFGKLDDAIRVVDRRVTTLEVLLKR